MKRINTDTWKRKEHFEWFNEFDEPFFGITSEIECKGAYDYCKKNNVSFFAYYLHKSLAAANQVEELKYRIKGDDVILVDRIDASPTIGRDNGTFAFSFIKYSEDFELFNSELQKEVEAVQNSEGLRAEGDTELINVIHFSSIPWIKFTGVTHARNLKVNDSCPKITFGKLFNKDNKLFMPISVNAHHGLVDGKHVGEFLTIYQDILNSQ